MNHTTSKITNMTEGNPVRIIMAFAVPLFIGNVFQQIYNLVDTMIAGHFLGDGAIAAIGVTSVTLGYLGVAVTEPVIWCLCALFLGTFYVTIGHQKQTEEDVG